jgi:3-oxoacyl-[acyl-carrier-protein] synthase-3
MTSTSVAGIAVRGIHSVLPATTVSNADNIYGDSERDLAKVIASTGIAQRRIAVNGQTAFDLTKQAATSLIAELNWQQELPELIVMVTQTPDFMLPGNAVLLQHYLGCAKSTVAFDVNLGCSGFVYGLWQTAQLLNGLPCKRALLVVGDTTSALCDPENHAIATLFGDAVAVVGLEKDCTASTMYFDLGSDGSGAPYLTQPYGAARHPDSRANLQMNGTQVFAFTLREVPKSIKAVMQSSGWQVNMVDYVVMHQANAMMLKHLSDKVGFSAEQTTIAMQLTGNTSSASIPLAMTQSLQQELQRRPLKLVLSGFGVGWSWGSACIQTTPDIICQQSIAQSPQTLNV